jgi:chromosome segregation ATPase
MESIKHKMDTMVKEKEAATDKANSLEAEAQEYEKTAAKFEKDVSEIQRKIAKVEDDLDITISVTKDTAEKLELADKVSFRREHFLIYKIWRHRRDFYLFLQEAVDAELQAGALKRRLALLEEETMRNKERLQENIEKCKAIEASGQENEDARKAGEARSFAAEESLEQMETQLEEANEVAKISNQKFEDASRKLKVVEGDCERVIERAEEFETKGMYFSY